MECLRGCRISGRVTENEIPLPRTIFYLLNRYEYYRKIVILELKKRKLTLDHCWGHNQVGSLAGAAHLLDYNTGVLR